MRRLAGGLSLLTPLSILLLAMPLGANESVAMKRTVIAPNYDLSKEVMLEGTVQSLVKRPVPGSLAGAHLIVATAKGTVDAHIGNYVISGPHAESFASGQAVKLVGILVEVNHQDVFIVRTIQTGNRLITIRNDHGFLVPPGSQAARLANASSTGGVR
jgi:archaeosine-15-forming tRNA-guanine transglycosylase